MNEDNVTIGGYHVLTRWGLIMTEAEISPPEPEVVSIDVPGHDGLIDITDNLFGRAPYKNRSIVMRFAGPDEDTWASKYSDILQKIHGKTLHIIFDSDPDYYYAGRCTVSSFVRGSGMLTFDVQASVAPYKYSVEDPDVGIL